MTKSSTEDKFDEEREMALIELQLDRFGHEHSAGVLRDWPPRAKGERHKRTVRFPSTSNHEGTSDVPDLQ
jgi:hypothetical protein